MLCVRAGRLCHSTSPRCPLGVLCVRARHVAVLPDRAGPEVTRPGRAVSATTQARGARAGRAVCVPVLCVRAGRAGPGRLCHSTSPRCARWAWLRRMDQGGTAANAGGDRARAGAVCVCVGVCVCVCVCV